MCTCVILIIFSAVIVFTVFTTFTILIILTIITHWLYLLYVLYSLYLLYLPYWSLRIYSLMNWWIDVTTALHYWRKPQGAACSVPVMAQNPFLKQWYQSLKTNQSSSGSEALQNLFETGESCLPVAYQLPTGLLWPSSDRKKMPLFLL